MEFTLLLIRIQELLLAWSIVIQSAEFVFSRTAAGPRPSLSKLRGACGSFIRASVGDPGFRVLHGVRLLLALVLIVKQGSAAAWSCLLGLQLLLGFRHRGAFNGGSDSMTSLILISTTLLHLFPGKEGWIRILLGYCGMQTVFSYFIAGVVKARNTEWWTGRALQVFLNFSSRTPPDPLVGIAGMSTMSRLAAVGVILFELSFPLSLLHPRFALGFFVLGLMFHYANHRIFGLNRFFWAWLASYPSVYFLSTLR
jgi:hypothetical protein